MEHLSPLHSRLSSVVVTTPQAVALSDAIKCISFTRTVSLPVLGVIENMSGFVCPCCGEVSNIFSTGGGEELARREELEFLGSMPVDTDLVTLLDAADTGAAAVSDAESENHSFDLLRRYEQTSTAPLFARIVEEVVRTLDQKGSPS